jgi:glycosyltransferase involved in cell wall biosynthesis
MSGGVVSSTSAGATTTISVVLPCYNASAWVGKAIQSVLDQDYPGIEIIVVDDGSSDDSLAIVRTFGNKIRWLSGPNRGACAARNRGLGACAGDFVLFLDADDYLYGKYLLQMAKFATPGTTVVVGAHAWIDTEHNRLLEFQAYQGANSHRALLARYLTHPMQSAALLWERKSLLEAGGWNEGLPISQDAELALRMFLRGGKFEIAVLNNAHAVWCEHRAPRITNRITQAKVEAMLSVLSTHAPGLIALQDPEIDKGLAVRFYSLSRLAYANGHDAVGKAAQKAAAGLGLTVLMGTPLHRFTTRLFGLRLKTRIAAQYHRVLARATVHQRPYPYNLS